MKFWPAFVLLFTVCLLLGFLGIAQVRGTPAAPAAPAQSTDDQATYLSQLIQANEDQQASLDQLRAEIAKYQGARPPGSSNLVNLLDDLQQLRMFNGEVDLTGPGVQVRVSGADNPVQVLQDLTNELRNAGAEAIALNQVRLVTRSVIGTDDQQHLQVDGQPISEPYLLEAIGDPATLEPALTRPGGLIELLTQAQGASLSITVTRRDAPDALHLPRTALAPTWRYATPVPDK